MLKEGDFVHVEATAKPSRPSTPYLHKLLEAAAAPPPLERWTFVACTCPSELWRSPLTRSRQRPRTGHIL